jgi:signal transduction histidine kinase
VSPRTISLDVKYPAIMTGLALLTSAVFVWLGQRELTKVLQESAGVRLRANGAIVASMLSASVSPTAEAMRRIAGRPEIRSALAGPVTAPVVAAARAAIPPSPTDSNRIVLRLLDRAGDGLVLAGRELDDGVADWARQAARAGKLSSVGLTVGPFRVAGSGVAVEVAYPVHARDDDESLVGWVVELRRVQGRGVAAVRQLVESATLIVGALDDGAWTDLERVVPGPPSGVRPDTVVVFDDSPRGAGVGVATRVAGTPWVVWMERERAAVLAPLSDFRRRVAPVAIILALLTLVLVWRVSHRITNRVVTLTERVDRMAADPLIAEAKVPSPVTLEGQDEIERLEASFDAMFDRTRRQMQLEAQLLQAQKLEAVGRLAGGVAHDFNNVLTVITNYGEMLRADAPEGSQTAADLDQVLRAADRAARLTRQLLAFSKRQIIQPRMLDINGVVSEGHSMLRRLIPTNIELELDLAESMPAIFADPIQIEQVIVNLAVNAADAMPDGGKLSFRTFEGELDVDDATPRDPSRRYACVAVRDTGHGMDRETIARIFEPFFTTKPQGKGTGLGLATVHGIITQLGGRIWVYSEPGRGTTFKVFLPIATAEPADADTPLRRRSTPPQGTGQVLVVEDDEGARGVTARLLQQAGFEVRLAPDGATALAALEAGPLPRVVVSDLMMPGLDGAELSQRIRERWPSLPVVIVSGYADVELQTGQILAAVVLEKPFTARALVEAIARAAPPDTGKG